MEKNNWIPYCKWAEKFIILPSGKLIQFEPHQRKILDHVFTPDKNGKLPYQIVCYSCPKKSGKTTINAITMGYWVYNVEAPNEIICVANKKDQSIARGFRELRGYIERNPILYKQANITKDVIELKSGSFVRAIPNDHAGEAGWNLGLSCFDELWGFSLERDLRLWDELTPVPTRKNSIRFISTYAEFTGESQLLEDLYHQIFNPEGTIKRGIKRPLGKDFPCYAKGGLFLYWDHEGRMPWQTKEYYRAQELQLRPSTFLRLHKNMWVSSESGLFPMQKWDECTDRTHRPPLPDKVITLWVGVDASTKRDRSAVVSVYRDGGVVKLGPKKFWQPTTDNPLDLEETMEQYLLELHRGYSITSVRYDPYQFHRSATTLLKRGLPMQEFPQTTSNLTEMGQNLYDLVEYGNIVLYPCKDLRYEASCAIARDTGRGLRIVKEKSTAKIDQIIALAMGALEAVKGRDSYFSGCDFS